MGLYILAVGEDGELVVDLNGREVHRRPLAEEALFAIGREEGGLLTVSVDPPSGPGFDDEVRAFLPHPRALRVGVVAGDGPGPFLRAALAVSGRLIDATSSGVVPPDRLAGAAGAFDVLIAAGETAPANLPPGNWILLTGPPGELGISPLPATESAPIWKLASGHPVTRGVDAAEVQVAGAVPALLPEGAEPLLELPGGAVAAAGERDGVRYVWIGLDPGNSTLPLSGAYPLMIRNALRWFASLEASALPPAVPMGDEIVPAIRLPAGTNAVALTGPGAEDRAVMEVEDGGFTYRPSSKSEGKVALRVGEEEHFTFVNALLPGESDVEALPGGPVYAPDRSGLVESEKRLWLWFVLAAALFLLLEWALPR